ncbi:hypothetical protein B9Z55_011251 [Caenorhabditis nigoni]|uniref:F-box domain-containing protein n=1 Tax=Caenorhabditis nigoni TaxID=1611254 RepID=A0A2G5UJU1_9PELO|nr:hypothetical protein B9Z55_011251 [Caenorhabditis nigoni]
MTNQKFPFQRLPNDLCSMVLKTVDPHEIIAYPFTSKKALSMVRSLHIPIKKTKIKIGWPSIYLDFGESNVLFNWKMGNNEEGMTSFDDIPISVDVTTRKKSLTFDFLTMQFWPIFETTSFTWSNQEKSIVEWVKHLCSISRCERYEAEFQIGKLRFDLQSLQDTFTASAASFTCRVASGDDEGFLLSPNPGLRF